MKILRYIFSVLTVAALAGCGGNEPVEPTVPTTTSEQICFSVPAPKAIKATKTPLTDIAQIQNSSTTAVYVYGTRGANSINGTYYEPGRIYYNATGIWSLNWGTATWVQNSSYNFWGWAYSPTNATSNGLNISNNGLGITVTQPTTYSTNTIDYMLAHQFPAQTTSSSRGPIVTLEMEHALAMIEVYVLKNPAMYSVEVSNISISGFAYGGTLTCDSHSIYGDGTTNHWTVTSAANTTTYTLSGALSATDDRTTTESAMKFIAIPQALNSAVTLTVSYSITELDGGTPQSSTQTFQLFNYYNWESACRNIYTLMVDTSIHLYASIAPWPVVSYVNGTILPEIK